MTLSVSGLISRLKYPVSQQNKNAPSTAGLGYGNCLFLEGRVDWPVARTTFGDPTKPCLTSVLAAHHSTSAATRKVKTEPNKLFNDFFSLWWLLLGLQKQIQGLFFKLWLKKLIIIKGF